MAFKQILIENLKSKIDEDKLHFLPSGFQRIGDIIVLNLNKEVLGQRFIDDKYYWIPNEDRIGVYEGKDYEILGDYLTVPYGTVR